VGYNQGGCRVSLAVGNMPWLPDMELQDLVFALLDFGLALVQSHCQSHSFWNRNAYSVPLLLEVHNFLFDFTRPYR
jgi:hypothetical protein